MACYMRGVETHRSRVRAGRTTRCSFISGDRLRVVLCLCCEDDSKRRWRRKRRSVEPAYREGANVGGAVSVCGTAMSAMSCLGGTSGSLSSSLSLYSSLSHLLRVMGVAGRES